MKQYINREKFMFRWVTKNHEIVVGFKNVKRGKCSRCDKAIPLGSNICDECFGKDKKISRK
jgi:hypothetical protein